MAQTAASESAPGVAAPDAAFWIGVAHWQRGQYLDALEIFEELWAGEVGERRRFLQGLIHATMGYYYLTRQDWASAGAKLASAAGLLAPVRDAVPGVDLQGLRDGLAEARAAGPAQAVSIAVPRLVRGGGLAEAGDGH